MPKALDECVSSVTAGWTSGKSKRPTPPKHLYTEDGKPPSAESQAYAICTATLKKKGAMEEELTTIALSGMTLLGVAVTNRPHLKGLPPVKLVKKEVEGEDVDMLRIPLLLQGIFRHSKGDLVFNKRVFDYLDQGLKENIIGQDVCVDSRHNPDWGALGWLGPGFPGTGLREENDILVAYAVPTPTGKEKIEQRSFRYASAELHSNFQHPRIGGALEAAKLSTDDINILTLEQLAQEEDTMDKKDKDTNPTTEEVTLLSEQLTDEQKKREELDARLLKLEAERDATTKRLEGERDATIKRLEEAEVRLAKSDHEAFLAQVDAVMARAEGYRDKDGKGHPKILLETARSLLLLKSVKTGDGDDDVIKLEHEEDKAPTLAQAHKFYHDGVVFLLENLPGLVPAEAGTHGEEDRLLGEEEDGTKLEEEVEEFIKHSGGKPRKKED